MRNASTLLNRSAVAALQSKLQSHCPLSLIGQVLNFDVLTPAAALRIAAVTPFTSIDFPGKLSAVVFLRGCPWRCSYCHNRWMRSRRSQEGDPNWAGIEALLKKRKGLLDGIVFSGGEPCMDPALPSAVRLVKDEGFLVGLHTSGAYPRHLKECIGLVDWVGLDVKGNPDNPQAFEAIAGISGAHKAFMESFEIIRQAGTKFEARTTAHPDFLSENDLIAIAGWLRKRGADTYAIQIYRKAPGVETVYDPVPEAWPSAATIEAVKAIIPHFTLRRE